MRSFLHPPLSLALFFSTAVLLLVPLSLAAQEVQIPAVTQDRIAAGLPTEPIATPQQPRKVLIYGETLGFRRDSIPVGTKTLQMLGASCPGILQRRSPRCLRPGPATSV